MKSRSRLYCPDPLSENTVIALTENQVHYLRDVLRMAEGGLVSLFNEQNGEWDAAILSFRKNKGDVRIEKQTRKPLPPAKTRLVLAQALIKRDAMDFLCEKASELGVHRIQPLITDRTQSSRTNIARLQTIAMEAAEQCDRLDVPDVQEPVSLARFLGAWPKDAPLLFAAESGDATPIKAMAEKLTEPAQTGFLIGPEGGFTDEEHAMLRRHDFIRPIRLGPRLMRAETAAIATLAAFQAIKGDWVVGS